MFSIETSSACGKAVKRVLPRDQIQNISLADDFRTWSIWLKKDKFSVFDKVSSGKFIKGLTVGQIFVLQVGSPLKVLLPRSVISRHKSISGVQGGGLSY